MAKSFCHAALNGLGQPPGTGMFVAPLNFLFSFGLVALIVRGVLFI